MQVQPRVAVELEERFRLRHRTHRRGDGSSRAREQKTTASRHGTRKYTPLGAA